MGVRGNQRGAALAATAARATKPTSAAHAAARWMGCVPRGGLLQRHGCQHGLASQGASASAALPAGQSTEAAAQHASITRAVAAALSTAAPAEPAGATSTAALSAAANCDRASASDYRGGHPVSEPGAASVSAQRASLLAVAAKAGHAALSAASHDRPGVPGIPIAVPVRDDRGDWAAPHATSTAVAPARAQHLPAAAALCAHCDQAAPAVAATGRGSAVATKDATQPSGAVASTSGTTPSVYPRLL